MRVSAHGGFYTLKPGHVAYRCSKPPKGSRVRIARFVEGKPDPAGYRWHPVVAGRKLTPVRVADAPGERLLFYWPGDDLLTLSVGDVVEPAKGGAS